MAKKNALGRGLGALIEDAPQSGDSYEARIRKVEGMDEISVDQIVENPFQPRTSFDEEAINELAASIKKIGIVQPITVRKMEDGTYQLIAGERRLRASKLAGLKKIPAFVRKADDQGMLEMALVENIQRQDLDSIEIAISYQRLIEECKLTQETLSDRVGKKRSTVTNYLRLLKLPAEIQIGIREKKLTMGHARTLVSIDDANDQLRAYYKVIDEGLSVRDTEKFVRSLNGKEEKAKTEEDKPVLNEEYNTFKEQLNSTFKSKVDLRIDNKGTGKIVIPFKSEEDLSFIMDIFSKLSI